MIQITEYNLGEYNAIKRERNLPKRLTISRRFLEHIYWKIVRNVPVSDELKTPYLSILDELSDNIGALLGFNIYDDFLNDAFFRKFTDKRDKKKWYPKREFYTFNQLLHIYLLLKEDNEGDLNRLNNLNNILWYPDWKKKYYFYEDIVEILIKLKEKKTKKENK